MKVLRFFILILVAHYSLAKPDKITIHNRTPRTLSVGIYYLETKLPWEKKIPMAKLSSDIILIGPGNSGILERPRREIGYDRQLVFADEKEVLKSKLSAPELLELHALNVGDLQGSVFYIGEKLGDLYGFTTLNWNARQSILKDAEKKIFDSIPSIKENPYRNKHASVRVSNEIPIEEKKFLTIRLPRIKSQIQKILKKEIDDAAIPKIAIACSGGGYRAMLFTIGALLGAQQHEILDTVLYLAGTSGSTWAIGGWVLADSPLKMYHDWLISHIHFGLKNITSNDMNLFRDYMLAKYFYDEPLDLVDIYGGLLANELFARKGESKQRQTLSSQATRLETGRFPLPIYTAISAETLKSENLWYEFTPYEVGAPWLNCYVPSWAFGSRKFKNGSSVPQKVVIDGVPDYAPEQNFGVLMGTFGLAIGITLKRLILEVGFLEKIDRMFFKNIVKQIIKEYGEKRCTSSDFLNFTYGMPKSPFRNSHKLRLVDAGINFNLPYPPISGQRPDRKADIIIFVDASAGPIGNELRKVEAYARKNRLPLPAISGISSKAVQVFQNENNPDLPVIIYISMAMDKSIFSNPYVQFYLKEHENLKNFDISKCLQSGPCSTFNFTYAPHEAKLLANLGTAHMIAAHDDIVKAIELKVKQKSKK